jgi:hypothetical protein
MPRPLGMLEATRYFLPVWEEQLPPVPQEEIEAVGKVIAEYLTANATR